MPDRSPAVPSRRILTALRAAAIVIIATGLNDVISGALPRYEPLYLYLAAIALIVLLDGVLLGGAAALLAVAFYALLFTPRPLRLAPQLLPLGLSFATVLVAGIVRVIIRRIARRRRHVEYEPEPIIIEAEPILLSEPRFADNVEVLHAIDELRDELREREAALERTLADRVRAADSLRDEIASLRSALDSARTSDTASQSRAADLEQSLGDAATQLAELQITLATMRAEAGESQARIANLQQTLTRERGEAARTQTRVAELEHAIADSDTRIGDLHRAVEAERGSSEVAVRRAADAEARIAELERASAERASRITELEQALTSVRGEAETRIADLERALASERAATEARTADLQQTLEAERASVERAASRIAESEEALGAARADAEARIADLERTLASERATSEARTAELQQTLESERASTERAASRIAELEEALGAARADADARIADLERTLASERAATEAQAADLQQTLKAQRTSAERDASRIAELEQTLASARADAETLRRELESERTSAGLATGDAQMRIADLEQALAATRGELDTRVANLARTLESERSLTSEAEARVAELQQALAAAHADADTLRCELENERASATRTTEATMRIADLELKLESERALRAGASDEFDRKLNTIVTHLAQDHEADLGKAVEEREEARAEARNLNMRLASLQKKYDDERHLAAKLLAELRAAGQAEIDRLQARIVELEKPRQPAIAAPEPSRPRILIAHPDADLRMNARTSLERAGYEIVSAADGLEALRTAIAQRPDVVIADAVMPKMDGRELCQLLKSQEKTAHIRVILLLRATDEPPKGELVPDEILRKPVPLETLKATLATLLSARV